MERGIPESLKNIVRDSGTKIIRTLKKKKSPGSGAMKAAKGRPDRRQVLYLIIQVPIHHS